MASGTLKTPPASLLSSSTAPRWKYDVFLSFRGSDTRKNFTFELYDGLKKRGIRTFMDEEGLEKGDEISPALLKAIDESWFAIIVLSKHYAFSTWCLEELTKICQSIKDPKRILPVFYEVQPADVRHQKNSFEEAFITHDNSGQNTQEKVQQWKDALNKVANFSGWNSNEYKTDRQLVENIVEFVCPRVIAIKTAEVERLELELKLFSANLPVDDRRPKVANLPVDDRRPKVTNLPVDDRRPKVKEWLFRLKDNSRDLLDEFKDHLEDKSINLLDNLEHFLGESFD